MKRWLAVLAACGGSSDTPPAPVDASQSTGSVTVTVTDRGKPVAGVPVFFSNSDGTTTFSAITSDLGACGFNLDAGYLTVQLPKHRFGIDRFYTWSSLVSGDKVFLDLEPPGPQGVDIGITIPRDTASVDKPYVLYTSCPGEEPYGIAPDVKHTMTITCAGTTADFLVLTIDPDTNVPQSSLFASNVPLSPNITLGGGYSLVPTTVVSYVGVDAPYGFAYTTHMTLSPRGRTYESTGSGNPNAMPTPDVISFSRVIAPGAAELVASSKYPLLGDFDEQVVYSVPPMTDPVSIDLGQRLPGYMNEAATDQPPIVGRFDFVANQLVWTETAATGLRATFARARVRFTREDVPLQGVSWTWDIVAPRTDERAVTFPKLDATADFFNPLAGDTAAVQDLTNVLLPTGMGYEAIRDHAFDEINTLVPKTTAPTIVQRRFIPE